MDDLSRIHGGAHVSVHDIGQADDETLTLWSRAGDDAAFAELYRRHAYGAIRLARHLGQRSDAEDVVAESFARLLEQLRRGRGPDQGVRAYLYATVRHEAGRRARVDRRTRLTDDDAVIDTAIEIDDKGLADFEKKTVRAAYESLPERWRSVIWKLDVEGRKPHDIAAQLDLSPNSVSALVYRARSALRDAYVQQHVNLDASGEDIHTEIRSRLGAVVRGTASGRNVQQVNDHLEQCAPCRLVYLELAVDAGHLEA